MCKRYASAHGNTPLVSKGALVICGTLARSGPRCTTPQWSWERGCRCRHQPPPAIVSTISAGDDSAAVGEPSLACGYEPCSCSVAVPPSISEPGYSVWAFPGSYDVGCGRGRGSGSDFWWKSYLHHATQTCGRSRRDDDFDTRTRTKVRQGCDISHKLQSAVGQADVTPRSNSRGAPQRRRVVHRNRGFPTPNDDTVDTNSGVHACTPTQARRLHKNCTNNRKIFRRCHVRQQ